MNASLDQGGEILVLGNLPQRVALHLTEATEQDPHVLLKCCESGLQCRVGVLIGRCFRNRGVHCPCEANLLDVQSRLNGFKASLDRGEHR